VSAPDLKVPREMTWRDAGSARSAPMKTPSTAPAAAAEDAATAAGTPDSTVLPRTDSVPPASLTDDAIVISSSPILDSETLGKDARRGGREGRYIYGAAAEETAGERNHPARQMRLHRHGDSRDTGVSGCPICFHLLVANLLYGSEVNGLVMICK